MDNAIQPPPVANVCCADAQISAILSIKAASSIIRRDTASDLPASLLADVALICEPFTNLKFNLLFSAASTLSHEGKY